MRWSVQPARASLRLSGTGQAIGLAARIMPTALNGRERARARKMSPEATAETLGVEEPPVGLRLDRRVLSL